LIAICGGFAPLPPIFRNIMTANQIKAQMSRIQHLLNSKLSAEEREMLEEDYEDLRQELIEVTCY
jgi:hypothetical protein